MTTFGKILGKLARLLLRIGAWALRVLGRHGREHLISYLVIRIDRLKAKAARARSTLRREWLAARVAAWRALASFLQRTAGELLSRALDDAVARASSKIDTIPEHVDAESFARWKRARGRGR